jgi:hypothetical protein
VDEEPTPDPLLRCSRCEAPVVVLKEHVFLFDGRKRFWVRCVVCGAVRLRTERVLN